MTDLLTSLVDPSNLNSSQESFHSISSQPPSHDIAMAEPTTHAHASAFQAAGLPIFDAESFLTDPKNASLRDKAASATKPQSQTSKRAQQSSDTGEPVSLGSKTSHYVGALNTLCQTKGFLPVFEIEGDASVPDFGGALRLRDVTIASEERWHSKKEAREALAQKGLETARGMPKEKSTDTGGDMDERNWVGMLLEYHNRMDPNNGPRYELYTLGPDVPPYGCTCTTPHVPDRTFGSANPSFTGKKSARVNAAKEAVEHLIATGEINPDGSTKARKKVKLGAAVRIEGRGLEVKKGSSYAQRVQDICPLLGLTSPQYVLIPAPQVPNMLSGFGSFPNQPGMPKQIGEIRNVFGKKNAKEEIAMGVWDVLKELAQKRGVKMEGVEED